LNQIYDGFSSKKTEKIIEWWDEHNESYPSNYYYLLYYCLDRQIKLTYRDITYIKGSIVRTVIIASIAASLFNNLPTREYNSMTGIIYFSCMQNAVSGLSKFS